MVLLVSNSHKTSIPFIFDQNTCFVFPIFNFHAKACKLLVSRKTHFFYYSMKDSFSKISKGIKMCVFEGWIFLHINFYNLTSSLVPKPQKTSFLGLQIFHSTPFHITSLRFAQRCSVLLRFVSHNSSTTPSIAKTPIKSVLSHTLKVSVNMYQECLRR